MKSVIALNTVWHSSTISNSSPSGTAPRQCLHAANLDALIRPAAPVRALHDAMWNAVLIKCRAGLVNQRHAINRLETQRVPFFDHALHQRHGEHSFPAPVGIRIGARPPLRVRERATLQCWRVDTGAVAASEFRAFSDRLLFGNLRFPVWRWSLLALIWHLFRVRRHQSVAHLLGCEPARSRFISFATRFHRP